MKTVYLIRNKARIVDRNKFLEEHDASKQTYKMLKETPLLICIEGSYIAVDDLPNLVANKCHGFIVSQWVLNVKSGNIPAFITYKWRR